MARPKKAVDIETLKKLAAIQCTTAEMAAVLGVSSDTLERRFAAIIKDGRENGRMSLKRKQFEVAMSGNTTMLIWLGKQWLNQRDKTNEELDAMRSMHQPQTQATDHTKIIELVQKAKAA